MVLTGTWIDTKEALELLTGVRWVEDRGQYYCGSEIWQIPNHAVKDLYDCDAHIIPAKPRTGYVCILDGGADTEKLIARAQQLVAVAGSIAAVKEQWQAWHETSDKRPLPKVIKINRETGKQTVAFDPEKQR